MRRFALAIAGVAMMVPTVIAPAAAQTQQQIDWCDNKDNAYSPELRIDGCTAAIQSGRFSGKSLAIAYNNRCWAHNDKRESDLALADCNEAIRLDPKYAVAYNNRANAYRAKGDYDTALADYNRAIWLDPKFALAYSNRGLWYQHNGDHDTAIADYNQAIRLDPKFVRAYSNRGNAYRAKGDYDRAIADYNEAVRLNPKDAGSYNGRGNAYKAKGELDRAIADYTEAIRLDPKNVDAYFGRGTANLYAGGLAKALADLNQASALDPKYAYAALWLDVVDQRSKLPSQLERATAQLDMTKWPAPVIRLYLGRMTAEAVLAAADDADAATRKGEVCEANFYTGELDLQQGRKEEATRLFQLAAASCPKSFIEFAAANAELKALGANP